MATHIFSHFSSSTIIKQDTNFIAYAQKTEDGEGIASVYPVMPGIEVTELELHTSSFLPMIHDTKNIIEINHCREGWIECQMKDGCLQYVGEGDLFLNNQVLIYLHYFDPHKEKQKHVFAHQQVDIVKQIQKRMTTELSHRFTIEEIAREYCISATALKSNFKGVYGTSIAVKMPSL